MPSHPFNFPKAAYVETYKRQSYVHIKNGVTPDFVQLAQAQIEKFQTEQRNSLTEWEIKNKKQQYLFDLPDNETFLPHLFEGVATVTGLPADNLTLAERHLHIYAQNAAPMSPPHKDRLALEVTLVMPLSAPADSRVVLYPNHERAVNPFVASARWRASLDEADLPENILKDVEPVLVDVRPGDVIFFPGSAIYHGRLNAAGTIILTMKFNTMCLDPLGEDPRTEPQRQRSLEILAQKSDTALLDSSIALSPRLYRLSRHYSRLGWQETVQAYLWGEKEFTVSKLEQDILMNLEGITTVKKLLAHLNIAEVDFLDHIPSLRRLGHLGGVVFLS